MDRLGLCFSSTTRAWIVASGILLAFAAGADDLDRAPLRIVGSGYSMPVLMAPWIEAFEAETGFAVEVEPTGTSTGPPALIEGRADIAAMTRPLRPAEVEAIERRFGAPAIVLPVARDEVAVFVNQNNPIERITLSQIDAIYSRERRCGGPEDITQWGQLGVSGVSAERAIALFGRRPGSGTASFFRTRALCGGRFKDWMRISPGRSSASLRVVESRFGIGFGSLRDRRPGMKALAVAQSEAGPFVRPGESSTPPTDSSGPRYPLARTFDFVVAPMGGGEYHPALLDFLEFVVRKEAQSSAGSAGYAPLSGEQRATARARIASLRSGAPSGVTERDSAEP